MSVLECRYVVVGGGIAGVTCAETLSAMCPEDRVTLVTASPLVKVITNYQQLTKTLEQFDVEERPSSQVESGCPNVSVLQTPVSSLDPTNQELLLTGGGRLRYQRLCICTGGRPKLIAEGNPYVLGIRDTESVKEFQKKLHKARRILVVGNGGIATELVYEVRQCQVVWAVKDRSITSTFVDPGAGEFFLQQLNAVPDSAAASQPLKRLKYTTEETEGQDTAADKATLGSALGPDWSRDLPLDGAGQTERCVHVEFEVEVGALLTPEEVRTGSVTVHHPASLPPSTEDWPVYVRLTNGQVYGCDLVVSATGVVPNTAPFLSNNQFAVAEDGGLVVNERMETSLPRVYAAGDVCSAGWNLAPHWLQMRLWSQARQMGHYAAKCMIAAEKGEPITQDFCFEIFAHATKFFGFKVVLLGKFNAQGLGNNYELQLRITKGEEYIKVVLIEDRLVGAVLVGETDLEETFENLILNQIDLAPFKDHLLDSCVDIEDFFD